MRILGAAAIVAIVSIGVLSVAHSDLRRDRAAHRSAAEPEPPRFDPSTADEDGLAPRRVMGYRKGRPRAIEVITIGWAEVEVRTAQQFLRMREAAAADGVELIIRSGYRSHERQAWLYQAWRAGYGNRGALWRKDSDGWTAHETPARETLTDIAWTAPRRPPPHAVVERSVVSRRSSARSESSTTRSWSA